MSFAQNEDLAAQVSAFNAVQQQQPARTALGTKMSLDELNRELISLRERVRDGVGACTPAHASLTPARRRTPC
jgi:hypothetical protein